MASWACITVSRSLLHHYKAGSSRLADRELLVLFAPDSDESFIDSLFSMFACTVAYLYPCAQCLRRAGQGRRRAGGGMGLTARDVRRVLCLTEGTYERCTAQVSEVVCRCNRTHLSGAIGGVKISATEQRSHWLVSDRLMMTAEVDAKPASR